MKSDLLTQYAELQSRILYLESFLSGPADASEQIHIGALVLDVHSATLATDSASVGLTPTELILLHYLLRHPNRLFSSEKLLQNVWACPPRTGDPATVRFHIKNLRTKMEVTLGQPRCLHTVAGYGYILRRTP